MGRRYTVKLRDIRAWANVTQPDPGGPGPPAQPAWPPGSPSLLLDGPVAAGCPGLPPPSLIRCRNVNK